jgi:preprotein translocase subunit SecD
MENLRLRTIFGVLVLVLMAVWISPNLFNTEKVWWPSKRKLNYGLDIQGGLHLVMGVDVTGVVTEGTNRLVAGLKGEFTRDNIEAEVRASKAAEGEIEIKAGASQVDKVNKILDERYSTILQRRSEGEGKLVYRYYDAYLNDYKNKIIQQAIETIRNRIDEFGVAEPSISQQGADRILIQLPGMADAEKAKQLINTTAKLDFMLVEDKDPAQLQTLIGQAEKSGGYSLKTLKYSEYISRLNKDLQGKIPDKTLIYFEKSDNAQNLEAGRIPYLLRADTNLGGDALTDAYVSFDQYGAAEVALRFNETGKGAFKALTGQNRGRRMAVVLDKVVKTAPNINSEIPNGEAVITLGGGRDREKKMEEAKMIAMALRAGALPAALEQLEERRVGPTLGADSIKKAQMASWIGAVIIIIFMLLRYRSMGIVSNLALALNVLSVLALLTTLGATLTLPGIAGIALTVGFAVDANVLINERMREELHKGSSFARAVKEGYERAMSAILDANITTAATACVLYYFGTGPVRGFAVTLLIGIVTTLFANVFMSKVMVDVLVHKLGIKKLSV